MGISRAARENWISHFRTRQGEISKISREIRVGEQLEAGSWWTFRPAHRILRQEKSRTKKTGLKRKISCIGRSIWCVETVVCGGHGHVKPWERASWRISRLSGPLRRRFARFCGDFALLTGEISKLSRMFSYFLARGNFAKLCVNLAKGEFRNEFREILPRD